MSDHPRRTDGEPPPHGDEAGPVQRLFTACDVEGYSQRRHYDQRDIQSQIRQLHERALAHAGIDPANATVQGRGDGDLIRWSAGTTAAKLLADYVRLFHAELTRMNATAVPDHQLRVRMSVVSGVSEPGDRGWAGNGPVLAARLVDSPQARQALMCATGHSLVVVVDDTIYQDFVAAGIAYLRPQDYVPVVIDLPDKKFRRKAWIQVPGCDPSVLAPLRGIPRPPAPRHTKRAPRRTMLALVAGIVVATAIAVAIPLSLNSHAGNGSATAPRTESSANATDETTHPQPSDASTSTTAADEVIWEGTVTINDASGIDVGALPITVSDLFPLLSFYLYKGDLNAATDYALSQWSGSKPPNSDDCAGQLRRHSEDKLTPETALEFCTRGYSNSRLAYVKITKCDINAEKIEILLKVWKQKLD